MNPVDTELQDIIARNSRNMREAQRGDQQYRGDWQEIREPMQYLTVQNGAGFRYGRISFVNVAVDYTKYFAAGQALRYKQVSGIYKYAYITKVTTTYIEIFGGSTYVLANEVVTSVAKGIVPAPTGFPVIFSFDPQIAGLGGTYSNPNPTLNELFVFSMTGPLVTVKGIMQNGTVATGSATLTFISPTEISSTLLNTFEIGYSTNLGTSYAGLTKTSSTTLVEIYRDVSFAPFAVGVTGSGFNFTITYIL